MKRLAHVLFQRSLRSAPLLFATIILLALPAFATPAMASAGPESSAPSVRLGSLKAELQQIAQNGYGVPEGSSAREIGKRMIDEIGTTDPELRDDLIYTTFARWIRADVFSAEELKDLLSTCAGESHLTHRIGEAESDAVFKRTFSVLVLVELVGHHLKSPYLDEAEVKALADKAVAYLHKENDLRGYMADKGWAHAVAHTADLFNQLVQCKELDSDDMQKILDVMRAKMITTRTAYAYGEEWRMAKVVITMLRNERVSEEQMGGWLRRISRDLFTPLTEPTVTNRMRRYGNAKNFLMNVHLRCLREELPVDIRKPLQGTLLRIIQSSEG